MLSDKTKNRGEKVCTTKGKSTVLKEDKYLDSLVSYRNSVGTLEYSSVSTY